MKQREMAMDHGRDSKLGEADRQTAQTSSKQGGRANNIILHSGHRFANRKPTLYEQPVVIPA